MRNGIRAIAAVSLVSFFSVQGCKMRSKESEVAGVNKIAETGLEDGCKIDPAKGAQSANKANYQKWLDAKKIEIAPEYANDADAMNTLWATLDFIPPNMLAAYMYRPGLGKIYFGPMVGENACSSNEQACSDLKFETSQVQTAPSKVTQKERLLLSREGAQDFIPVFGGFFYSEVISKKMTVNEKNQAIVDEKKYQDYDAIMNFYQTVHLPFLTGIKKMSLLKNETFRNLISESGEKVKTADGKEKFSDKAVNASAQVRRLMVPEFFETARCTSPSEFEEKIIKENPGTDDESVLKVAIANSVTATRLWVKKVEDSLYEGLGDQKIDLEDPRDFQGEFTLGRRRLGGLFQGIFSVAVGLGKFTRDLVVGITQPIAQAGVNVLYFAGATTVGAVQTVGYVLTGNESLIRNNAIAQYNRQIQNTRQVRYNSTLTCNGGKCRVQQGGRAFGLFRGVFSKKG